MNKAPLLFISAILLLSCSSNEGSDKKQETINPGEGNVLVAYFSVTSNTKKLAEYAKEHLESDIFEIVPLDPYTSEDINYNNDNSRANKEQNDPSARPQIKYQIEDISKYETIVLGYPIWWTQAPKIMYTFIESYDFSGKTILPFCTSGSSPIGSSATNLAKSAPTANWLEGRRFAANTSKETINSWLDEYIKVEEKEMEMKIDGNIVEISWENNQSIEALKKILPIEIDMHEYGGFEQTGSIGKTIVSNDSQMNVVPGDVVLYNGNAISIFYNPSSWSYTKLGHINKSKDELNSLLNKESVKLIIE